MSRWKNIVQSRDEVARLKRTAVLEEAIRIFSKSGYHSTSLDDIAISLQISKGTLYNYFADKQGILYECHMRGMDTGELAVSFADAQGSTGFDKYRLALRSFNAWLNSQTFAGGVMTDISALRPRDRDVIVARRDQTQKRLIGFVEAGMEDGSVGPVDARLAVYTAMTAINATPSWFSREGRLTAAQVADTMADLLTAALRAPGYRPPRDLVLPDPAEVNRTGVARPRSGRESAPEPVAPVKAGTRSTKRVSKIVGRRSPPSQEAE